FTPYTTSSGGIAYSVSSITFAPVPYTSSGISWFDSSTGNYIASGDTLTVCPTTPTTYIAEATGCNDTSFAYITVTPTPSGTPVHINDVDSLRDIAIPTVCGICDGYIKLTGINPHIVDTIFMSYNGVPQAIRIDSAASDSSLYIRGLCAGTYDYIYVKQGDCPSNAVGPLIVRDPSFTASVRGLNPTSCGACDGSILISGLVPGYSDTINYMVGGVPQTPIVGVVGAGGSLLIPSLPAGTYTNITVKMNYCVTSPMSVTLSDPYFGVSDTSHTNTSCSMCDGTITLYGLPIGRSVVVNYDFNGAPQTPVTLTVTTAGTVTLTNLCPTNDSTPGRYDNITATLVSCVPNACVSSPVGPIFVYPPPLIPIRVTDYVHPTECGACNGTIKITGMAPGTIDTIFFTKNGVAQTPVVYSAAPDSSVTIYNLCAGAYSNFFVKVGPCPTRMVRSVYTLVDPPIVAHFTTSVNAGCLLDTVLFKNESTSPGALYYLWTFGDGTTSITTNPVHYYKQGTYTVKLYVTNHHCIDSYSVSLPLVHPIDAQFTTSKSIICQGVADSFINSSVGYPPTYIWSFGDGTTSTEANPTHAFTNYGKYAIRLVATNFVPCSDTAWSYVVVDTQSVVSMQISDTVLCVGSYITLGTTYSTIGNTRLAWSMGNGDSVLNHNPVVYAYATAGVYPITVTASYRACAAASATGTVTVIQTPQIALGGDTSICEGAGSILISDAMNAGNPAASWLWNTGETTSAISVTRPGTYSATVTIHNCQASDSVNV
ncbi:MAG: PKD domain-containing protein, partial [Chitinophagia bacterium]|nr:PKD domain-containing protein [Chitinophagia bacterium]